MPWKDRYTVSDERSIADAEIRWPDGARCNATITVVLDPNCRAEGLTPADCKAPDAYFGMHGGLDAVTAALDRNSLRATFAVSAALAQLYPDAVRGLAERGHEIAAHGFRREDVSMLDRAEEERRLKLTTQAITDVVGKRPFGWYSLPRRSDRYGTGAISAHTVDLLLDNGYRYLGNSPADDAPHYWVTDPLGPRCILAMPYYYHFDDQFFLLFPEKGTGLEHADSLARNWHAELEAQHARGRSFNMFVHPYASGWGHRLKLLDACFARIRQIGDVWNGTALECADHWTTQFPAREHLNIEPSIWVDHADSLN